MIPEFRGLYKPTRSWVYGSYIHCEIYGDMIKPFDSPTEYDVIPETVGQYTGLKDRGGQKIFVGDKIINKRKLGDVGEVVFWNGAFCVQWQRHPMDYLAYAWRDNEVVGNIHQLRA